VSLQNQNIRTPELICVNKQIDGSLVTIQYTHLTNMHSINIQCCFQFKQISDFIINRAYKLARKIDDTGRLLDYE